MSESTRIEAILGEFEAGEGFLPVRSVLEQLRELADLVTSALREAEADGDDGEIARLAELMEGAYNAAAERLEDRKAADTLSAGSTFWAMKAEYARLDAMRHQTQEDEQFRPEIRSGTTQEVDVASRGGLSGIVDRLKSREAAQLWTETKEAVAGLRSSSGSDGMEAPTPKSFAQRSRGSGGKTVAKNMTRQSDRQMKFQKHYKS